MIAVVTVVLALPLGLWCRHRLVAHVVYAVAYLWAFVYQGLYLLLDSLDPQQSEPAFEAGSFPLSYGVATLLVLVAGLALVEAGQWWRRRREARVPARVLATG